MKTIEANLRNLTIQLAVLKAANLLPNTQQRLTADAKSYWVFNIKGNHYVGYYIDEAMPRLFPRQPQYDFIVKGKTLAYVQRLAAPTPSAN